jgi:hypothetical protein
MAAAITFEILLGWFSQRLSFSTAHDESLVKSTLIGNSSSHVFRSPFLLKRTRPEVPSRIGDYAVRRGRFQEVPSNRLSVSYPVYPLPKTANLPNLKIDEEPVPHKRVRSVRFCLLQTLVGVEISARPCTQSNCPSGSGSRRGLAFPTGKAACSPQSS